MESAASDVALSVVPKSGTTNSNGITRDFSVTAGKQLTTTLDVIAVNPNGGGKAEVGVQFKFRRSNGTVVDTKLKMFTISGEHTIGMAEIVPSQAVTVDIAVGVNNPTNSSVIAMFPVIVTIIGDAPFPEECEEPPVCEESCDLSCPAGEHEVSDCVEVGHPACTVFLDCYCADDASGVSQLQQASSWSDF